MASHAQIDKNVNDTLTAWDQVKGFFGYSLPYFSKQTQNGITRIYRAKRRF
jgi:hypothetical protein